MIQTHEPYPDAHHDSYSKTVFGFWIYLLGDFMLFATLFAAYAVLHKSTFGGPGPKEIFNLPFEFAQTLLLLSSAFTIGLGGVYAHRRSKRGTIGCFALTFLIGAIFMWMELSEFAELISVGRSWKGSAFLSAFFTLVGTHGIHMVFALIWIVVLLIPIFKEGVTPLSIKRLTCLRMFWQFLNIVWIFIFTLVYLMGVVT